MSVRGIDITDLHYREVPDDSSAWDATPGSYDPVSAGTDLGGFGRLGDGLLIRRRLIYADATDAALKPIWQQLGPVLELHRRITALLVAIQAKRMPALTQPPTGMTTEAKAELKEGGLGQVNMAVQAAAAVASLVQGLWDSNIKQVAAGWIGELNLTNVNTVIGKAQKAYLDAGGSAIGEGEVASSGYVKGFKQDVRRQFKGARIGDGIVPWPVALDLSIKNRPQRGWFYFYIDALRDDLKRVTPALREVQVAHLVGSTIYKKEEAETVVEAIGNMLLPAVQQGAITTEEVPAAVSALHKLHQGYALTSEESKLVKKLRPHLAPKTAVSKWALPAAAVGIPALLYAL